MLPNPDYGGGGELLITATHSFHLGNLFDSTACYRAESFSANGGSDRLEDLFFFWTTILHLPSPLMTGATSVFLFSIHSILLFCFTYPKRASRCARRKYGDRYFI